MSETDTAVIIDFLKKLDPMSLHTGKEIAAMIESRMPWGDFKADWGHRVKAGRVGVIR